MNKNHLKQLHRIRTFAGKAWTQGLDDETISRFLEKDKALGEAISAAAKEHKKLVSDYGELFKMDEVSVCRLVQESLLNFYPPNGINFYLPIAAVGPWIVTAHGAVLHDSGGYGMLGLGHAPATVLEAMNHPYPMANVMTPSISQKRFTDRLEAEIGRSRGSCPYSKFVCLNSGSESVTFTCRVTDTHSRQMTDPGGKHAGRTIARLAMIDSFHGRTEGPARLSESCRKAYTRYLASFREADNLHFVPVNDLSALRNTFEKAEKDGVFFEAFFVEPVMGEGIAGLALSREYYDEARAL